MTRLSSPWIGLGARALTALVALLWLAGPLGLAWPDDGGMPAGLYDGADDDTAVPPSVDPVGLPEPAPARLTTPRASRPVPPTPPPRSARPAPLVRPALRAPPTP